MKRLFFLLPIIIFFIGCSDKKSQVYYFSSQGDDNNKGTITQPWKTIDKLNSLDLNPGDTVYFFGGDTLQGTILIDSIDSGERDKFVSFFSIGHTDAVIKSGNESGLVMDNAEYILLSNLTFIGSGRKSGNTKNGVAINKSSSLRLQNLDISGYQKSGFSIWCSIGVQAYNIIAHQNGAAGIAISGEKDKNDCRHIYLSGCKAFDNPGDPTNFDNHSGNGIVAGLCRNVHIAYCMATNNGWDMPRVGNGPVGIWAYEADSVLIQHCISYRNKTARGAADGGGFDLDGGVTNSTIEYCLSYENEGAGFGIFQYEGASNWYNNTIRYNISENDGNVSNAQAGVYIWNGPRDEKQMKDLYFHNNIIYNTKGAALGYAPENEQAGFKFYNNVFVAKDDLIKGKEINGKFENNNWWSLSGNHPDSLEENALHIDPKYKNAGNTILNAPSLIQAFTNYQLPPNSPLLKNRIGYFPKDSLQPNTEIASGDVWKDTDGNFINAHGGGILFHNGTYYWFGEIKKGLTWRVPYIDTWEAYRVNAGGVSCYSSKDLLNWKFEGVALSPNTTDSSHDLHTSKVIERPKVIYNDKTKQFVMWMHIDSEDYAYARAGVAVSDNPAGPFRYLQSVRPNGNMSRDMTIYKDDDGKAYHFYASEGNKTMRVAQLSDDYLSHTTNEKRILKGLEREAPAIFKYDGKYYLITSGCTGWSPNAASWAIADNILGEWKQQGNPCVETGREFSENTFRSQSTFILPLPDKKDSFLFMADRWNKTDLEDSRYVWLPLEVKYGKLAIEWKDKWSF
jgi:hypothetical protein